MIIMVVFYWRIYRTANKATAAIRRGFIASSCNNGNGIGGSRGARQSQSADADLRRGEGSILMSGGLRVHRGGGGSQVATRVQSPSMCSLAARHSNASFDYDLAHRSSTGISQSPQRRQFVIASYHQQLPVVSGPVGRRSRAVESDIRPVKSEHDLPRIVVTSPLVSADADSGTASVSKLRTLSGSMSPLHQLEAKKASPFSRLNQQLRSLNREKKAAKTVGVIVGCFIVCWAPFFSVYLLNAFCGRCTPETLFDVFFWLGYCNSVANPIIYGLCSRDFRYAFTKLLRCRCERRPPPSLNGVSTLRRHNSRLGTVLRSFRLQIATETSHEVVDSYS